MHLCAKTQLGAGPPELHEAKALVPGQQVSREWEPPGLGDA